VSLANLEYPEVLEHPEDLGFLVILECLGVLAYLAILEYPEDLGFLVILEYPEDLEDLVTQQQMGKSKKLQHQLRLK
jgi:hypothetical protein